MTETEILLQLWADTLADVQADKNIHAAGRAGRPGRGLSHALGRRPCRSDAPPAKGRRAAGGGVVHG